MNPTRETPSINQIRTAIRQLSVRAQLAHKEGRQGDAADIEHRIDDFRHELSRRPKPVGRLSNAITRRGGGIRSDGTRWAPPRRPPSPR